MMKPGLALLLILPVALPLIWRAVRKLRDRGAMLDELFEKAPQAVAILTLDYTVIRVNQEFTRVFGYTTEEAHRRPLSGLIVPGEALGDFHDQVEMVSKGERVDVEAERRRKDGSRLHVLVVTVPVSLPDGTSAVCVMYRDISQRKAAELSLQSLSQRLLEVQEEERKHLARELHDHVGQQLTGLRLLLRTRAESDPASLLVKMEQARGILDDLISRVRGLSFDLRPADLDQLGMLPALLSHFERYTAQTGIQVNFKHWGMDGRLSPQLETGAYRIVQEALTNCARHAGVAGVTVCIWKDQAAFHLLVEDSGCGFNPDSVEMTRRTSGLSGMRERCLLLGGKLMIESAVGSGTVISAEFSFMGPESELSKVAGGN